MVSRRDFLIGTGTLAAGLALGSAAAPKAHALGPILGTVLDYAAGVPSAQGIKNAGHLGVVRYVSDRRPGTETWMLGKPLTANEANAERALGLGVASVYQFGKGDTADWKAGYQGGVTHAQNAIRIHFAAGGPVNRPIYAAIDDNPTWAQYDQQIRPYLQGFNDTLRGSNLILGVYGNFNVLNWAMNDGLGSYFWQHDWGSNSQIHERVTIHQKAGLATTIDGVTCDVNNVYAADWGQWNFVAQPVAPLFGGSSIPGIVLPPLPGSSL
ncbi:MAG: DUF1906 domain-containing protein [Corynebacterium sp.]|nr:DUF1906 domain-containing protein [Corynebacterium sp.]